MKENEFTSIKGRHVILVPYERKHVPKYNGWMQSEELQQQTGSDPLTLEQEYDMQKSWREDDDKCTFILLDADMYEKSGNDEIASMVGDVNIFICEEDGRRTGELTLMIAEKNARRKGMGKEALTIIMRYGIECSALSLQQFTAKIGYNNEPSLQLFTKMGFEKISQSDVFQEVTVGLVCTDELHYRMVEETPVYDVCQYQSS